MKEKRMGIMDEIKQYTLQDAIEEGTYLPLPDDIADDIKNIYDYPVYLSVGVLNLIIKTVDNQDDQNDILRIILKISVTSYNKVNPILRSFKIVLPGTDSIYDMFACVQPYNAEKNANIIVTIFLSSEYGNYAWWMESLPNKQRQGQK